MNVGFPLLVVAVRSLATVPHTVAASPTWLLAFEAEIGCATVGAKAIPNDNSRSNLRALMLTSMGSAFGSIVVQTIADQKSISECVNP